MLKNYDPKAKKGTHTIKIVLQVWEYKNEIEIKISENLKGSFLFENISERIFEGNYDGKIKAKYDFEVYGEEDEMDGWFSAVLKDDNSKEMLVKDLISNLENIIVSMQVIDFKEEQQKAEKK